MAVVNSSKMNFADVVQDMLQKQYYPYVVEVTTQVINEVSKETVKKLKQESPVGPKGYAKGWTSKVEKGRLTVGGFGNESLQVGVAVGGTIEHRQHGIVGRADTRVGVELAQFDEVVVIVVG